MTLDAVNIFTIITHPIYAYKISPLFQIFTKFPLVKILFLPKKPCSFCKFSMHASINFALICLCKSEFINCIYQFFYIIFFYLIYHFLRRMC